MLPPPLGRWHGQLLRTLQRADRSWPARAVLNAPVAGALYVGLLYLSFVTTPLIPPDEVLFGRDAKELADHIAVRFAVEIREIGLQLGTLALVIGAALGTIALLLLVLRDRVQARPPARRTGAGAALSGLAVVAFVHAFAVLLSMSKWPQLYVASFWARGGALATLQVLATDRLGTSGLLVALASGLVLLVCGVPWKWPAIGARALAVARRARQRPRAVFVALALCASVPLAVIAITRPRATGDRPRVHAGAEPKEAPKEARKETPPPTRRRSVLVIASDGLRPDRIRPEIAPHLSALSARGTTFDRAYVDIPRTMSSWATMLTGLHPHHHGIRSGCPTWEEVSRPLDSLPARLRARGYRTAAVSDYVGEVFGRVDFGFDLVDVPPSSFPSFLRERAIERSIPLLPFLQSSPGRALIPEVALWSGAADPSFVAASAVDVLRQIHRDPFMMVVFFSTTHFPYAAPSPYHRRFTLPDYSGPFRYDKTVMASVPVMPTAADVRQIRGLYDGSVAAVDDAVGTILDEVARLGAAEDLVIVVTSDHGEVLFEHDRWHGHGDHLFGDEGTHIPMIIVDPRVAPRHEPSVVASVDLAPSLYDLLGVAPPEHLDGRSLAPAMRGEPMAPAPVFAETELWLGFNPGVPAALHMPAPSLAHMLDVDTEHGNQIVVRKAALEANLMSRHRMVRDERWKLLYMPTPTGVVYRLFDTASDPEELTDVLDAHPDEAARLRGLLWDWMLADPHMVRDGDYLVPKGTRAPVPLPAPVPVPAP